MESKALGNLFSTIPLGRKLMLSGKHLSGFSASSSQYFHAFQRGEISDYFVRIILILKYSKFKNCIM